MTLRAISARPKLAAGRVAGTVTLSNGMAVVHTPAITRDSLVFLTLTAMNGKGVPSPAASSTLSLKLFIPLCTSKHAKLNPVLGLVPKLWYRIPCDQSELSISKIPPTDSPTFRLGHHP